MVKPTPVPGWPALIHCEKHGKGGSAGWRCPDCPADAPPARLRPTKATQRPAGQAHEDALWGALGAAGLDYGWETQVGFVPGRRFRADFAHAGFRLLLEVEGQVHAIRGKREGDCERACLAAIHGWRMLRVTPAMVKDGRAIDLIRMALEGV